MYENMYSCTRFRERELGRQKKYIQNTGAQKTIHITDFVLALCFLSYNHLFFTSEDKQY